MIRKIMYEDIQKSKRKGLTIEEAAIEAGICCKTAQKYWFMTGDEFLKYKDKLRFRIRYFEPYRDEVLLIYKETGNTKRKMSSVYDVLVERHGDNLPEQRIFRDFIHYLEDTKSLVYNKTKREYRPVPALPYGEQMQVDFGEHRMLSGLKLYIFGALLSASRHKFVVFQDKPFTTMDAIRHLLASIEFFGGRPKEMVIDQDSVLVVSENHGDIICTSKFQSFIEEQEMKLFVCRKSDPESKGKIESLVKYVKQNFLDARNFSSLDEAAESLAKWRKRANSKISAATNRIPEEELAFERLSLRKPKASIFMADIMKAIPETRKVEKQNEILYKTCRYPMPAEYCEQEVFVREVEGELVITDKLNGCVIRQYPVQLIRGSRIKDRTREDSKKQKSKILMDEMIAWLSSEKWKTMVLRCYKEYYRYFRDQYLVWKKNIKDKYDPDAASEAVSFCLDNNCFSMNNLVDTCQYLESGKRQPANAVVPDRSLEHDIKTRYPELIVTARSLSDYKAAIGGGLHDQV